MSFEIAQNVTSNYLTALTTNQDPIHMYTYHLSRDELMQMHLAFESELCLMCSSIDIDTLPETDIVVDVFHLKYLVIQIGLSTALFAATAHIR